MGTMNIDVAALAAKAMNLNGFGYDEGFLKLYSRPSRVLTDFFGIQPVKMSCPDTVKADFVPGYAGISEDDGDVLRLDFNAGFTAAFHFDSAISIGALSIAGNFVEFSGARYDQYHRGISAFLSVLNELGLTEKYLPANRFYEAELRVYELMNSGRDTAALYPAKADGSFGTSDRAVLIYPDRAHGDAGNIRRLLSLTDSADFDWIAFEMLGDAQQPALDSFLNAAEGSREYRLALARLCEHFSGSWRLNEEFKSPEDNYFIRVLMKCRQRGKRVYALELSDPEYLLFRNGETEFGGAVRSDVWAERAPKSGRGMVVGGSAHFMSKVPINFQDLYLLRRPEALFYIMPPESGDRELSEV